MKINHGLPHIQEKRYATEIKADHKRLMRVGVQFRTISMDWWASLEHKIRYKKGLQESDHVDQELFECAKMSAELDSRMEKLQQFVGDLYE